MPDARTLIDDAAEALVVPSFTRVGYELRRRLYSWEPLDAHPMRGRVAAVTGATSGLGEVTVLALARLGAAVRILARSEAARLKLLLSSAAAAG